MTTDLLPSNPFKAFDVLDTIDALIDHGIIQKTPALASYIARVKTAVKESGYLRIEELLRGHPELRDILIERTANG